MDTTEQIADIFTKGLAAPQFEYLVSKLMGWNTTKHSPSLESARLRGSDAGHQEQGLAATEVVDQGLLSSLRSSGQSGQARPAARVSWLEPIDDSRLVRRSVENWTATSEWASLRRQQRRSSQATRRVTGRPHTSRRPSTGTSWLRNENYHGKKATLRRPSTRYGRFKPKLFKLCRDRFHCGNSTIPIETYH